MSFGMKCLGAAVVAFGLATSASADDGRAVDSLDDVRIAAMKAAYVVDAPQMDPNEALDPVRLAWIRSVFVLGNS